MDPIVATLLGFAADQFFGELISNATDDLYKKLNGDPVKKAYKLALGNAIKRYATGDRIALARPLLGRKSILRDKDVVVELAKLLRFGHTPNPIVIAQKWQAEIKNPSKNEDFNENAKLFLMFLEEELRDSEVFRPAFEASDVHAIAFDARISTELQMSIEAHLEGISEILDNRLGELLNIFTLTSLNIREQIVDFSSYVAEKTYGFVGRQWVFDEINNFLNGNPRGYFFLRGDPGIGKTSLAAQMVKKNGYLHHFNLISEGINKPSSFLKNISAQLIASYSLEYLHIPPDASEDAGFLIKLFAEVSRKLRPDEKCVILIDALDEVDVSGLADGANRLYLPKIIPDGIFIIVTLRDDEKILPRVDCQKSELIIKHDSSKNIADLKDYIFAYITENDLTRYIRANDLKLQEFVNLIAERSEGNFMYLRYVLPEITNGAYVERKPSEIPVGLKGYYEDHWQRMKGHDLSRWFDYKLPTLVGLTVAQEPISVDEIAFLTKLKKGQVYEVLNEWKQFIHVENNEFERQRITQYRLYHLSFLEFIAAKQEVADERVDLGAMHTRFANSMWDELLGEQ